MIWWWRNRLGWMNLAVLVAVVTAAVLIGGWEVPVLNVLGGSTISVPIAMFLPVACAVAFAAGIARASVLESVAYRQVHYLDLAFVLALSMGALAASALLQYTGLQPYGLATARNVAGCLGLALVGRRLFGVHAAPLPAAGYVFVAAGLGTGAGGRPHPWAWPIAEANSVPAFVLALMILVGGLLVGIAPPARTLME